MASIPKVSILIPTYNRADVIEETLQCAVNQTYCNIEIIVGDNRSVDDTYRIVQNCASKYPFVSVFQNQENLGPARNWRQCLSRATGEYAKILWSDDLIAPDFVETCLPYLVNHNDVGFVFTPAELFCTRTGKRKIQYNIAETGFYDTELFIRECLLDGPFPTSPGNAIFRTADLKKNLLIDVPNKIGSDFKMHTMGTDALIYLLTAKEYPKFAFVNRVLSFFRSHSNSITISSNRYDRLILYNIAKAFFSENYIDDEKLKRAFKVKLSLICLMGWRKNNLGVKSLEDFYFKEARIEARDFLYAVPILRRLLAKAWGKYGLETRGEWLIHCFQNRWWFPPLQAQLPGAAKVTESKTLS